MTAPVMLVFTSVAFWCGSSVLLKRYADVGWLWFLLAGLALTLAGEAAYIFVLRRGLIQAQALVTVAELILILAISIFVLRESLTPWRSVGLAACLIALAAFSLDPSDTPQPSQQENSDG